MYLQWGDTYDGHFLSVSLSQALLVILLSIDSLRSIYSLLSIYSFLYITTCLKGVFKPRQLFYLFRNDIFIFNGWGTNI